MTNKEDMDYIEPRAHNWFEVLIRFAQIAGTFAGFCITFMVLVIGGKLADNGIFPIGITNGQLSVILFGISAVLFIFSSQRFLEAQEHNLWNLPPEYKALFRKKHGGLTDDQWEDLLQNNDGKCRQYEKEGGRAYNCALLAMITGIFFIVGSYNWAIAILVSGMGYALEAYQILR